MGYRINLCSLRPYGGTVSNPPGNGCRKPIYATAEDWKAKIKESICGRSLNGLMVSIEVWFDPRKGEILDVVVGDIAGTVRRWPNRTGLIRIFYLPETDRLSVDRQPKIYQDGKAVPIDQDRQTKIFSAEVLKIFREIDRQRLG